MNYDEIIQSALKEVEESSTSEKLEQIRVKYFGKNGTFTNALKSLSTLSIEDKKTVGEKLNGFKNLFFTLIKFSFCFNVHVSLNILLHVVYLSVL